MSQQETLDDKAVSFAVCLTAPQYDQFMIVLTRGCADDDPLVAAYAARIWRLAYDWVDVEQTRCPCGRPKAFTNADCVWHAARSQTVGQIELPLDWS